MWSDALLFNSVSSQLSSLLSAFCCLYQWISCFSYFISRLIIDYLASSLVRAATNKLITTLRTRDGWMVGWCLVIGVFSTQHNSDWGATMRHRVQLFSMNWRRWCDVDVGCGSGWLRFPSLSLPLLFKLVVSFVSLVLSVSVVVSLQCRRRYPAPMV